jgi:hypothetical protein
MLDSRLSRYLRPPPYTLYTCSPSIYPLPPDSTRFVPCLVELALPLEAEGLVDKELAEEGDEGHDDGNAVTELVHHIPTLVCEVWTYPRTTTAGLC